MSMLSKMISPQNSSNTWAAAQDFRRARRQAVVREMMARLTGKSVGLLSFEQVRQTLKAQGSASRGLQDIPLDAIVGSVGRYTDFTRDFLPLGDASEQRWVRVNVAAHEQSGVPPIEVYKIGEVYFVLDGNHRVSVARQLGATHIQGYVTEVKTKVPLTPDIQPDDLIVKAEYADFLEQTRLDELRPGADLSVTVPGQYSLLLEHIQVHRYFMGIEEKRDIPFAEAVTHWYDNVYLPVVQVIRERGILADFPGRTETDLYLWVSEHRATLEKELGWTIKPEAAASDLVAQFSPKTGRVVARLGGRIVDAIVPEELEAGPPAGQWRQEKTGPPEESPLFADLLVPVSGEPEGWNALEQAIVVAKKEDGVLHGLHVVQSDAQKHSPAALAIQTEFERRCQEAAVAGALSIATGTVPSQICSRSRWVDLLVVNLAYPPAPQPLSRLSSGFSNLIRRCSRPILAAPGLSTGLNSALLAYDGSPKAEEALFVATYLALKWTIPLWVVTVIDNGTTKEILDRARKYLTDHGVQATYLKKRGGVARTVLKTAETVDSDLIIMGGYGSNPVVEVVLGSSVDRVLRESRRPVLVCR
jgi:nucleotide-binding universal stress UspA family protein